MYVNPQGTIVRPRPERREVNQQAAVIVMEINVFPVLSAFYENNSSLNIYGKWKLFRHFFLIMLGR